MTSEQADTIINELEILKKLKILELTDRGYSQKQLAKLLGVSQPTISRMIPRVTEKKRAKLDE